VRGGGETQSGVWRRNIKERDTMEWLYLGGRNTVEGRGLDIPFRTGENYRQNKLMKSFI